MRKIRPQAAAAGAEGRARAERETPSRSAAIQTAIDPSGRDRVPDGTLRKNTKGNHHLLLHRLHRLLVLPNQKVGKKEEQNNKYH